MHDDTRTHSHTDGYKQLCSPQEYERLAAQLDGARAPLAKKVQEFTWVDSRIPLVERAEKHSQLLEELARNISQ